jgi:type I restriction enzyme M protein
MTRITQQHLESYLWGAAVLLRGTIDAGDYKQFIFPLLFFKRVCDVYDEETLVALRDSGGDQDFALFPENHRFQVPTDAHWREVRKANRDVGHTLQQAMRAIEVANQEKLMGIFGDAQWTNKDRLSDSMLRDLIEHFCTLELTVANLPEDELGQGYEYLIKKFADDSGHTAAEFYTNRTVVHLMTEILDVQPGESVYDPTCGSGGMLLSCITHLRRRGKEWRNVKLYGQERNLMTSSIARMNCFLHGIEDFRIERGDTLAEPKLVEGDRLKRFDVVLANPPYSIKQWNREAFATDPWGRNIFGVPPQSIADYAFQQHILQSLKPNTGRCAVLWPHGVLFRDAEDEMRSKMIEADLIDCIIGLGPNLFYNSSMPSCIVICRTAKPKARKGKILLINAVNEVTRERAQSFLTDEHLSRIVEAYRNFKNEDNFARVVTIEEVRKNNGNLNLQFYITPPTSAPVTSTNREEAVTEAIGKWIASNAQVTEALTAITGESSKSPKAGKLEIGNTAHLWDCRNSWKHVRLGDLLEKTEVVEKDPLTAGFDRYLMVEHMDANSLRIQRWGSIADENIPPTFYKVFRKGQILYPTRNPHLRRAAVAGFDGICGEKTLTLSVRDEFDAGFVPWVFQSEAFIEFATNRKIGSTNPHVRWRDVADFEFDLPPLDHQRSIAEILWAVEDVNTKTQSLLRSTAVTRQALAASLVDDEAFSKWPTLRLKDCIEIGSGQVDPKQEAYSSMVLVAPDHIEQTTGHLIKRETAAQQGVVSGKLVFKSGDVIFSKIRPNLRKCILAEFDGICSSDMYVLTPKANKLHPRLLLALLLSDKFTKYAVLNSKGTAFPRISRSAFEEFRIPVPPIAAQEQVVKKLIQIDSLYNAIRLKGQTEMSLISTLLTRVVGNVL